MSVIRVGSVGIGGISRGVHLPGIEASPDLQLAAVCDLRPEALEYAKNRYGIDDAHCFTDYHDLINCPDVDAVDISTPNNVHFEIAMTAAEAGKPFCLEKPICMDRKQADALAAFALEKGVKNMVCFSYRFKAAARYARDLVRRGLIGRIYHVDMEYSQAWGLPFVDCPLVWRFDQPITGTGTLGDLGSHGLDLVRFVTGAEYTAICGHLGTFVHERRALDGSGMKRVLVDDFSNAMAEMSDGAAATFRITRLAAGRGNYQRMEIYGSEGALIYELDAEGKGADTLECCSGRVNSSRHHFEPLEIPEPYNVSQMQCFADVINGKANTLAATIEDGCVNMHLVDALVESAREQRWVRL